MKCLMLNHDHQDNGCGHTVLNCVWALMSTGRLQWFPDMTQWFHPILTGLVMLSGWDIKLFPAWHTILDSDKGVSRIWASGVQGWTQVSKKGLDTKIFLGNPYIYPELGGVAWPSLDLGDVISASGFMSLCLAGLRPQLRTSQLAIVLGILSRYVLFLPSRLNFFLGLSLARNHQKKAQFPDPDTENSRDRREKFLWFVFRSNVWTILSMPRSQGKRYCQISHINLTR